MAKQSITSYVLRGVAASPLKITAEFAPGLPSFQISGVKEKAEKELRCVVRENIEAFSGRLAVSVAGGEDLTGDGLALPIALACEAALAGIPPAYGAAFGNLSLKGDIQQARGVYCVLLAHGAGTIALPPCAEIEAAPTEIRHAIRAVHSLGFLRDMPTKKDPIEPNFSDCRGLRPDTLAQLCAAAKTRRPVILRGPPGAAKTMIARRLPGLLPDLSQTEAREIGATASACGIFKSTTCRPFRAPHHTCSAAGLIGSRAHGGRPGEAALASQGVLFLSELPEFRKDALAGLRHALANGTDCAGAPCRPWIVASIDTSGRPSERVRQSIAKRTAEAVALITAHDDQGGVLIDLAPVDPAALAAPDCPSTEELRTW